MRLLLARRRNVGRRPLWVAEPTQAELVADGANAERLLLYGYGGTSRPDGTEYQIPTGFRHGGNTGIEQHGLTRADLSAPPATISDNDTVTERHFTSTHEMPASDVTYVRCVFDADAGNHCVDFSSTTSLAYRNTFIDCEFRNDSISTDSDPANTYRQTHLHSNVQNRANRHTFVRCNMFGGETVIYTLGYVRLLECFIHDPQTVGSGHWDGLQTNRGEFDLLGTTAMARYRATTYAINIESAAWHSGQVLNAHVEDCYAAGGNAGMAVYWRSNTWDGPGTGHTLSRICFEKGTYTLHSNLAAWSIHDSTTSGPTASNVTAQMGTHGADWTLDNFWFSDGTVSEVQSDNETVSWDGVGSTMPVWSQRTDHSAAW